MDNINWLVAEMLVEQKLHPDLEAHSMPVQHNGHRGMKRSLAARLVRLGLRLDPAAGEGLGAFDLALAHHGGRRS
jgi:hypothetical protein